MNAYSEDLRIKAINYLESGHTQNETSSLFGVCRRSIVNWLKLKRTTGSLKAIPTPRPPNKLQNEEVLEYVKNHPDAYLREVGAHFKCCNAGVYKALKRLGVTRKKSTLYKERDEEKRKRFIAFVKMMRPSRLVYADESGIDEFLYREYARARKGEKIFTDIPGRKFARCSIVAAKCCKKIIAPFGYTGTCNSKLFTWWLKTILIPLLKKGQILVLDNASIHKAKEIREIVEKAGCHLVFQPAYSPDLNPIEHSWSHMKQKIRSSSQNFASLFDAMQCALS